MQTHVLSSIHYQLQQSTNSYNVRSQTNQEVTDRSVQLSSNGSPYHWYCFSQPSGQREPPPRQGRTRRARGGGGHSRRSLLRFSVMLMTVRRMVTSHTSLVRRLLPFLSSMCSSLERIAVAAEGYTTTNTRSTNANAPFIGSSSTRPASSTPATASSAPSNPANPPRALSSTTQIRSRTRTTGTRRSLIRTRTNRRMGLSRIIETHLSRRGSLRERDR